MPALSAMYPSFFWVRLLSDNFFTWLYLVLFNKSPFPTLDQFTVYHIYELLCHASAQSLPHSKTVCWGWQTLTLLTPLLSLVIGVPTKDHILQHAVFGKISHMKARPNWVVNGCNLFCMIQIRFSIWEHSKVSVQFPVLVQCECYCSGGQTALCILIISYNLKSFTSELSINNPPHLVSFIFISLQAAIS